MALPARMARRERQKLGQSNFQRSAMLRVEGTNCYNHWDLWHEFAKCVAAGLNSGTGSVTPTMLPSAAGI